jgi:ribonuclease P protein component
MRVPKSLFSLLRRNKLFEGEFFSVRASFGAADTAKVICIVSKKIDSRATVRNKIKRQVYSILFPLLASSTTGTALQVFPKKTATAKTISYAALETDLTQITLKHNLL